MTPQDQLSVEGNLLEHAFAELVAEISHAKFSGSLRVSNEERKCVVYFKKGRIAFAVSNQRTARLFEMMLKQGRLSSDDLAEIPNFTNDIEFADFLEDKGFLNAEQRTRLFVEQIENVLVDVLSWTTGDWAFTPLARLRDGLEFNVDSDNLLGEYARCLLDGTIMNRFRSMSETFARAETPNLNLALRPEEMTVLSQFINDELTVDAVVKASPLPEVVVMRSLYSLWLAGILERREWSPAFSERMVAAIRSARLELKQEAKHVASAATARPGSTKNNGDQVPSIEVPDEVAVPEPLITLEKYLLRVEKAETYYDVLGVDVAAEHGMIKQAYFTLAKNFHPDHYHQEGGEIQRRVQNAFTELTRAHETLKSSELREHYNAKMYRELANKRKMESEGNYDERSRQLQQAIDSFETGFNLLVEGNPKAATPFLARATHFDKQNPRFHAYYGKALAADDSKRHQAESEMQSAIRLDPKNPMFRLMLAEFFISVNFPKRAEGELNRLLATSPNHREALEMMARIKN